MKEKENKKKRKEGFYLLWKGSYKHVKSINTFLN